MTVVDERAYIADQEAGLRIVDVSDPAAPVELGFLLMPFNAENVTVDGTKAYVSDGPGGLRIIDVSNPAAPVELGSFRAR